MKFLVWRNSIVFLSRSSLARCTRPALQTSILLEKDENSWILKEMCDDLFKDLFVCDVRSVSV